MTTAGNLVDWKHLRVQLMGKTEKPPIPPRLEVPKLPQTVSAVCAKANLPECTAADLCEVLERDSAITVDLLRHAKELSGIVERGALGNGHHSTNGKRKRSNGRG